MHATLILLLSFFLVVSALKLPPILHLDVLGQSRLDNGHLFSGTIMAEKQHGSTWKVTGDILHQGKKIILRDSQMYSGETPKCDALPFLWDDTILEKAIHVTHTLDKLINTQCQNLDKWLIYVVGSPVVLCTDPSTNTPYHIIMEQLHIQLQLSENLPSSENVICTSTKTPTMEPMPIQDPWFINFERACRLTWIADEVACKGTNKPIKEPTAVCIFLHGVGQTEADKGDPVNEFPEYWGKVHLFTPQCKERWFIREETKMRGWDNLDLQKSFCNLSLIYQDPKDTTIRNKIIFTHSMGNLILAGAIKNGICEVDTTTTSWYDLAGPLNGSKAADVLTDICAVNGSAPQVVQDLYRWIAVQGGYCMPGTNVTYPAYQTLNPEYPGVSELYDITYSRIKGNMCGISGFGLVSKYSPLLEVLSAFFAYGVENDGFVPITSCGGKQKFSDKYEDLFYVAKINHADSTCRNGDAVFGNTRPCSYYTDKV